MLTLARGRTHGECRLGFGRVVVAPSVPVRAETPATSRREVGAVHQAGRTGECDATDDYGRPGLRGATAAFAAV